MSDAKCQFPQCGRLFDAPRKTSKFCSRLCVHANMKKMPRKAYLNGAGYLVINRPHHPYSNGRTSILVHVMAMEMHIGRQIRRGEVVHHINGVKTDNHLSNLQLMSIAEHSAMHNRERPRLGGLAGILSRGPWIAGGEVLLVDEVAAAYAALYSDEWRCVVLRALRIDKTSHRKGERFYRLMTRAGLLINVNGRWTPT